MKNKIRLTIWFCASFLGMLIVLIISARMGMKGHEPFTWKKIVDDWPIPVFSSLLYAIVMTMRAYFDSPED
jgi:hypothetical protein